MSRFLGAQTNTPFVSRSAFDALTVDDVEDTDSEPQEEEALQTHETRFVSVDVRATYLLIGLFSAEPVKPSKSQIKKAQKQARIERRKQLKASSKAGTTDSSPRHTPSLEESIGRMAEAAADASLPEPEESGPESLPVEESQHEPAPQTNEPEASLPQPAINGDIQHVNFAESRHLDFCGILQ